MLSSHRFEAMLVQLRSKFRLHHYRFAPHWYRLQMQPSWERNADLFYLVMTDPQRRSRCFTNCSREILDSVGIDLAGVDDQWLEQARIQNVSVLIQPWVLS
jgi:hypothetical protein